MIPKILQPAVVAVMGGLLWGRVAGAAAGAQLEAQVLEHQPTQETSAASDSGAVEQRSLDTVVALLDAASSTLQREAVWKTAEILVREAAAMGQDPLLLLAIIALESGYNHRAVGSGAATGLMQITLPTAVRLAKQHGIAWSQGLLFDPVINVLLGSRYFAQLLKEFSGKLPEALTAYHRGPRATRAILRTTQKGRLPVAIYQQYAAKVLRRYGALCRKVEASSRVAI